MTPTNEPPDHDSSDDIVFDSSETVTFEDEEGQEHCCVVLAITEYEGEEYAMLAPVDQIDNEEEEELELYLFHYSVNDDDTEEFAFIEDEAIFNAVQEIFSSMIGTDEEA